MIPRITAVKAQVRPSSCEFRERACELRRIGDPALTRLLADAEPKDGDGSRPCAVERFQGYPGKARGREKANAVAKQDGQDIHQYLVHEPPPQALTGYVGA